MLAKSRRGFASQMQRKLFPSHLHRRNSHMNPFALHRFCNANFYVAFVLQRKRDLRLFVAQRKDRVTRCASDPVFPVCGGGSGSAAAVPRFLISQRRFRPAG